MTARQALWTLIGLSTALRVAWAASLGGHGNEPYYYMYANHLGWGYFDHPPMVGFLAALGSALVGPSAPVLGLRVGFIALFAGSTWLLARLTARWFGPRAGVLAALALNATAFYGLIIGTFADPDGPLLFFWLLTLDRLAVALGPEGRGVDWAGVGAAWGAAMLSKYHAVLLPAGVCLYLLLRPSARRCLRTPGPYLATAVGLAVFSPTIAWNAAHGWVSFLYQGTRAGGFRGFQPEMLIEAIVGQVFYLTPWIWAWLVAILIGLGRRGVRRWGDAEAFLACQAILPLLLFLGVATFRRIMPHWPLIGFVALLPLLGRAWSARLEDDPRRIRVRLRLALVSAAPVIMASLFLAQTRSGWFQDARGRLLGVVTPADDPTVDMIRWGQIARELDRRGLLDEPDTFLFTDDWRFSASLAMATDLAHSVACYHRDARSFTFWSRPRDWVGRDGIYVRVEDALIDAEYYVPWFTRVEPLAEFPIVRGGVPLQRVRVYRFVRQIEPFLFGYNGPGDIPRPQPQLARGDRGATPGPRPPASPLR
jgi:4-amino-4-deoxy-L-arabinose transferase-like glycosyltransferase